MKWHREWWQINIFKIFLFIALYLDWVVPLCLTGYRSHIGPVEFLIPFCPFEMEMMQGLLTATSGLRSDAFSFHNIQDFELFWVWSLSPHLKSGCLGTFMASGNFDLILCCYSSSTSWLVVHLVWSLYIFTSASHSRFLDSYLYPTTHNNFQVSTVLFSSHKMCTGGLICRKSDLESSDNAFGVSSREPVLKAYLCAWKVHTLCYDATGTPLISQPSENGLAFDSSSLPAKPSKI